MRINDKKKFNTMSKERNIKADLLHQLLLKLGVNFASGVPCGVLKHVIRNFSNDAAILHVPANRESEAVGLVAGAYFAGKTPVIYMQNSGLFAVSNDIASLLIPYEIPVFFIVSYRGCEGEDAIQHLTTGRATEALLQSLRLHFVILGEHDLAVLVKTMFKEMLRRKLPIVLLLKRGWQE